MKRHFVVVLLLIVLACILMSCSDAETGYVVNEEFFNVNYAVTEQFDKSLEDFLLTGCSWENTEFCGQVSMGDKVFKYNGSSRYVEDKIQFKAEVTVPTDFFEDFNLTEEFLTIYYIEGVAYADITIDNIIYNVKLNDSMNNILEPIINVSDIYLMFNYFGKQQDLNIQKLDDMGIKKYKLSVTNDIINNYFVNEGLLLSKEMDYYELYVALEDDGYLSNELYFPIGFKISQKSDEIVSDMIYCEKKEALSFPDFDSYVDINSL